MVEWILGGAARSNCHHVGSQGPNGIGGWGINKGTLMEGGGGGENRGHKRGEKRHGGDEN